MSYDDQFDDQQQSGGALRAQLEDALKKLKAAEKERDEYANKAKSATLETILRDKGVPANIQRWLKRDDVEPSSDAVDKWLAENGEDFGYKPGQAQTDSAPAPEGKQSESVEAPAATAVPSVLSADDIAALERIQGLLAGGVGQTLMSDQINTVVGATESNLGPDASFDDVVKSLAAQGIAIENSRG